MAISASTWVPVDRAGLNQEINSNSTTQKYKALARVKCRDMGTTDRGEGEFVYLKGVASTVAGDAVVYDESTGATTRTVAASKGPLAIAMAATVANEWGWYQIFGVGVVTAGTVADNAAVYTTATDGSLDDAQVDSQQVIGAFFRSADDTGFATIGLHYPVAGSDDQVT
jgi:hypothetical protein